jgi:hypothetical protein
MMNKYDEQLTFLSRDLARVREMAESFDRSMKEQF